MTITFDLENRPPITSVDVLVKDVLELRVAGNIHKLWFRGHSSEKYQLVPSIGRPAKYTGNELDYGLFEEKELLGRFRRRAFPHDHHVESAGYALILARHHGLPTRLLDWTAKALFALYFTCIHHINENGHLWGFRQRSDVTGQSTFELTTKKTEKDLFNDDTKPLVRIVFAVFNSARLIAQDGCFTWHSYPWTPLDELANKPFAGDALDVERLYRWSVPAGSKVSLLKELSGLGINHRSVYPDLDGIAQSLWETEVLWNGKLAAGKPAER